MMAELWPMASPQAHGFGDGSEGQISAFSSLGGLNPISWNVHQAEIGAPQMDHAQAAQGAAADNAGRHVVILVSLARIGQTSPTTIAGWLAESKYRALDNLPERPASSGSPTMQMKLAALKLRRLVRGTVELPAGVVAMCSSCISLVVTKDCSLECTWGRRTHHCR